MGLYAARGTCTAYVNLFRAADAPGPCLAHVAPCSLWRCMVILSRGELQ